ncbi:hypothetical protein CEXT_196401 [Caerostris extrusa]|uniref:Uncharacterized protein n=1 Tax=Caerostris extrusa TaxID=172846 RepID=A0AAV4M9K0_CAEEX|nr:hypothetical protein CEXT_196401 [Caerostris extrusa]
MSVLPRLNTQYALSLSSFNEQFATIDDEEKDIEKFTAADISLDANALQEKASNRKHSSKRREIDGISNELIADKKSSQLPSTKSKLEKVLQK